MLFMINIGNKSCYEINSVKINDDTLLKYTDQNISTFVLPFFMS